MCRALQKCQRRWSHGLASGLLAILIVVALPAFAQITPSDDSYTLTSSPGTNFGAKNTLEVESAGATTFVRFDLSSIPSTVTGSMVAKATLKIYISAVTTAGSFNVDLVTSTWKEGTITGNNSPTLGSAIASAVPVTTADTNQYVLVDVTAAAVDWLNGTANDGLAIVPDGAVSFALNSKETTTTSHPAELDIVLTGPQGPPGSITGVTAGAGLRGGGTKGNVTLSLLTSCASGQVLQWNGSTWVCATTNGSGTITGVTAGTDLTGGGTSGNVTLNLDKTKVPQLAAANAFTNGQSVTAKADSGAAALGVTNTGTGYSIFSNSAGTYNIWAAGGQYGIVANGQTYPITGQTSTGSPGVYGGSTAAGPVFGVEGVVQSQGASGVFGVNGTPSTMSGIEGSHAGVWGDAGSLGGFGISGTADDAIGVFGANASGKNATVYGLNFGGTVLGVPSPAVWGVSFGGTGIGVIGTGADYSNTFSNGIGYQQIGVIGDSAENGGIGVAGTTDFGTSVFGNSDQTGTGVYGLSTKGTGVYGTTQAPGDSQSDFSYGVWGYAPGTLDVGVYASSKSGFAFSGTTGGPYTEWLTSSPGGSPFIAWAGNGFCQVDAGADLVCTGSKSAAVSLPDNRWVRLYAVESPENWFEDFGSGQLSSGSAIVPLEPTFAQTVNSTTDYHVFLTPNGDSHGLFVAAKTATSFEVREQGGGTSNIAFDYRIVARRRGYENIRMAEVTESHNRKVELKQEMEKQPLSMASPIKANGGFARPQMQKPVLQRQATLRRPSNKPPVPFPPTAPTGAPKR